MSDQDLLQLYSSRILALASSIPNLGHLPSPQGAARKRAPLCGSVVGVELTLENGRVKEFAQDVRACALGQAAASVVGASVIGRTADEIQAGRDALWDMLRKGAEPPPSPCDGFKALLPARQHDNRHPSIMLAIEASLAAIENAAVEQKKTSAT